MLNNNIKERLRLLMWREDETRPDVVLEVVAKFTASSMQVREPGVKVWQWPWDSGAAILSSKTNIISDCNKMSVLSLCHKEPAKGKKCP